MGVLALLSVVSVPSLLSLCRAEDSRLLIFLPRFKWFYTVILSLAMLIWLAIVILNHQTFWGDVINFVFLLGFSLIWVYVTLLGYLLIFAVVCFLSGVVISLYAMLLFIIVCTGKLFSRFFH